jgi:hypothetical protein
MTKFFYPFLLSLAVWLVPFALSVPFFNTQGELIINLWLFKLIMVLVLTITTYFSTKIYLAKQSQKLVLNWTVLSFFAVFINFILDYFTVVQLSKLSVFDHLLQIGIIYLVFIPVSVFFAYKTSKIKN